jgi:hypothetical protein
VQAKSSKSASGTSSYRIVAKRKDVVGARLEKVDIPVMKHGIPKLPKVVEHPVPARPSETEFKKPKPKESEEKYS